MLNEGLQRRGDFVEAPAPMLENQVFAPEVLDRLGGHPLDPTRKLPRETIAGIEEARMFDAGYRARPAQGLRRHGPRSRNV